MTIPELIESARLPLAVCIGRLDLAIDALVRTPRDGPYAPGEADCLIARAQAKLLADILREAEKEHRAGEVSAREQAARDFKRDYPHEPSRDEHRAARTGEGE